MDHFYDFHGNVPTAPFLDVWTVLPALALATRTIQLGPLVTPVGYRNPALVARMCATFDHLSNGRLYLGFGAGGYRPEYAAYGYSFPERAATRIAQMEQAVALMKLMWQESPATFKGEYFHIADAICEPKPIQKPHPPILIGGVGERYLLRALARCGDACNLFGPPAEFRRERDILKRHCDAEGRDEATIEKTTYDVVLCARDESALRAKMERVGFQAEPWKSLVGTPAQLVDTIGAFEREGAQHLLLEFQWNDGESYELFVDEVMPAFGH
jgi:alkanesulfonate monooxygenase SsuD/methylene tetrahydromethanopterin reductase-like flavin-dependent oxidoreductase (luciferase family)